MLSIITERAFAGGDGGYIQALVKLLPHLMKTSLKIMKICEELVLVALCLSESLRLAPLVTFILEFSTIYRNHRSPGVHPFMP